MAFRARGILSSRLVRLTPRPALRPLILLRPEHSHSHSRGGESGHSHGSHGHSHGIGLKDVFSKKPEDEKQRAARVVTLVGLASNVGFAGVKGAFGVALGSHALVADAMHSVSDLVSDFATLIAVKFSRGRSPSFPYGLGKVENLAAFFVSGLLFVAGCKLLLGSLEQIISTFLGREFKFPLIHSEDGHSHGKLPGLEEGHKHDHDQHDHEHEHKRGASASKGGQLVSNGQLLQIAIVLAAASVVIKEGMYRWTKRVATELRSPALQANAWHHRLDGLSSLVSLVGVAGNAVGVPVLDPIAGALVSWMVVRMGWDIGFDNARQLVDVLPDPQVMHTVEELLRDAGLAKLGEELDHVHSPLLAKFRYTSLRARTAGQDVFVDLKLTLANPEDIKTTTAEEIAEAIEEIREHVKATPSLSIREVCIDFCAPP